LLHALGSFAIAIFGLSVGPNSKLIRYTCGLALIVYEAYVTYRPYPPTTPKFHIYQTALLLSIHVIAYFDHAIINNGYLLHKQRGQAFPFIQMSFLQRMKWSANIMSTNRGINWSWEVPHLRRSTHSRWLFVRQKFFHVLVCILVSDVLRFLREVNPAWEAGGDEGFGSKGFIWQIYNVALLWSSVASMQLCGYEIMSMVTVALGLYEPGDWPSFYGRLGDAKSIRLFWGRVWHQLLRRPLQTHGRFVATNVLGLKPRTNASAYTELYMAFLISGICHGIADVALSKSPRDGWTTVLYYVLQAVIITAEDGLIALGKVIGIRQVPSVMCYAWVIFWMGLLGPIWVESMVKQGTELEVPISFLSPSQIGALF